MLRQFMMTVPTMLLTGSLLSVGAFAADQSTDTAGTMAHPDPAPAADAPATLEEVKDQLRAIRKELDQDETYRSLWQAHKDASTALKQATAAHPDMVPVQANVTATSEARQVAKQALADAAIDTPAAAQAQQQYDEANKAYRAARDQHKQARRALESGDLAELKKSYDDTRKAMRDQQNALRDAHAEYRSLEQRERELKS
jgi:chromosome segregation ATPase